MSTDPIVKLACQFQAFISTKHPFISEIDPALLQSIELFAPSSTSSLGPAPAPASTSQERHSFPYPVEWAETPARLRSGIRQLEKLLKHRTASAPISAVLEEPQSHANHSVNPINPISTEESAPLISTTQASGT